MSLRPGFGAKSYRNTGSHGSPTWVEVDAIANEKLGLTKEELDATRRASGGWGEILPGLKQLEVTFSLQKDITDSNFTAIRDAFLDDTAEEWAFMTGDITTAGEQGLRASMIVTKFEMGREMNGVQMVDVALKITPSENAPEWYTVPS